MSLGFLQTGAAQRYAVIKRDILANLGCLTNDHSHTVVNEKISPDGRARVNLNASEASGNLRNPACEQFEPAFPKTVSDAVRPDGMQARIAQQNFQNITSRGVAV
jgi:hypothetical protein